MKIGPYDTMAAPTDRHLGNQIQQTSLLWLCALFIATYSRAGEAQTGIAGFPDSTTTTSPTLGLLVLGASWLDRALGCFGAGRWADPVVSSPILDGARNEVGTRQARIRAETTQCSHTGAGVCFCALPFKYSADCTLAVLQPALATVTSRLNSKIGRKHHERSRNGGAF